MPVAAERTTDHIGNYHTDWAGVHVRSWCDRRLSEAGLTVMACSLLVSRPIIPQRVYPAGSHEAHDVTMTDALISRTTRGLFRSLMTGSTVGKIGAAFQDEGFAPNPDCAYQDSSVRRETTQAYLEAVDWQDPRHVARVLRVFGRLMHGFDAQYTEQLRHSLRRDGYVTDPETGHITSAGPQFAARSLAGLKDASAIREQLDRIQRAISDDPALAVGSAKELIESTAKVVLAERGLPVSDKADLPELVRQAQEALHLHPASAAPGPDGTDAVKRILGGVSTIAVGLAELRNRGYGTRPRPSQSQGRPPRSPRPPRRQRSLHLVPADARHPRRPRKRPGARHPVADPQACGQPVSERSNAVPELGQRLALGNSSQLSAQKRLIVRWEICVGRAVKDSSRIL